MIIIIIGYDIFGGKEPTQMQAKNNVSKLYEVNLSNSKVDEIEMRSNIVIPFDINKRTWNTDNLLLAKFQNDLEGGNIDLQGAVLDKLIFKRRKIDDLTWIKIYECDFVSGTNIYSVLDRIVESGEKYEYAVIPCTSTIEGEYLSSQIDVAFSAAFIFDKTTQFKLMYNLEIGDIDNYMPNSVVETMGSKYPIVLYGSDLQYKRGSIKCILLTDTSSDGIINIRQEKLLREQIMLFLTNKKPKGLKSPDGLYMMINIVDTPKLTPNNQVTGMYDVSFSFVESGSLYDIGDLTEAGLV